MQTHLINCCVYRPQGLLIDSQAQHIRHSFVTSNPLIMHILIQSQSLHPMGHVQNKLVDILLVSSKSMINQKRNYCQSKIKIFLKQHRQGRKDDTIHVAIKTKLQQICSSNMATKTKIPILKYKQFVVEDSKNGKILQNQYSYLTAD